MTLHLSIDQILALHQELVGEFGGLAAVRDRGPLESAVARPSMTFGGDDLYPHLASKASALMHSLVLNHPFVDGNKRVGVAAAELLVGLNGFSLEASDRELEELTSTVAEGKLEAEALAIWFRQRLRQRE